MAEKEQGEKSDESQMKKIRKQLIKNKMLYLNFSLDESKEGKSDVQKAEARGVLLFP